MSTRRHIRWAEERKKSRNRWNTICTCSNAVSCVFEGFKGAAITSPDITQKLLALQPLNWLLACTMICSFVHACSLINPLYWTQCIDEESPPAPLRRDMSPTPEASTLMTGALRAPSSPSGKVVEIPGDVVLHGNGRWRHLGPTMITVDHWPVECSLLIDHPPVWMVKPFHHHSRNPVRTKSALGRETALLTLMVESATARTKYKKDSEHPTRKYSSSNLHP